MDELFGELRELVHTGVGEGSAEALSELLERRHALDPVTYDEVWIPYLRGLGLDWDFSLATVHGLDTLATWSRRAPFARFRLFLNTSSPRLVEERLVSPLFPRVHELHVDGKRYPHRSPTYARKIAGAPNVVHLAALRLESVTIDAGGLELLSGTGRLSALRALGIHGGEVDDEVALALATSPTFAALTRLDLRHNPISRAGADELRRVRPALEILTD